MLNGKPCDKWSDARAREYRKRTEVLDAFDHILKNRTTRNNTINDSSSRGHVLVNITAGAFSITIFDLAGRQKNKFYDQNLPEKLKQEL